MAAHRYWGLLVTARAGSGDGVALAEVEMRATAGGTDLCTGGTAGGDFTSGQLPGNAFDNSIATVWYNGATGGRPVRLFYDFGSPVSVAEMWLRLPGAGTYPGATFGPSLAWPQWSDDGSAWFFDQAPAGTLELGNDGEATISGLDGVAPSAYRVGGAALRLPTSWPAGPVSVRPTGALLRHDLQDGGSFRIAGTVAIDGTPATPVRRRVRLFHLLSGRLVRETWSDAAGDFAFEKIAPGEYIVMSDDYTRTYNAVVADRVAAVP